MGTGDHLNYLETSIPMNRFGMVFKQLGLERGVG